MSYVQQNLCASRVWHHEAPTLENKMRSYVVWFINHPFNHEMNALRDLYRWVPILWENPQMKCPCSSTTGININITKYFPSSGVVQRMVLLSMHHSKMSTWFENRLRTIACDSYHFCTRQTFQWSGVSCVEAEFIHVGSPLSLNEPKQTHVYVLAVK